MEAIHKSQLRSWIDDNVINVRNFCRQWCEVLPQSAINTSGSVEKNATFLQNIIPSEEYSKIEEECGLESMRCEFQERVEISSNICLPDEIKLDTLRQQEEDLNLRRNNTKYANVVYNSHKYLNFPQHKALGIFTDLENLDFEAIDTPEVVLSVQIYVPERRIENQSTLVHVKVPAFQVDQEFFVLGCQYLTELRDKIECVSDKAIPGDFSGTPHLKPDFTCKDVYKSGFFYINGVFYNDMRDANCKDYSDVIIKWSEKDKNRGIGPFTKANMENTKFIDLNIQLGYPYVYIHQGECEHLLVFSDIRMFSKHEVLNKNAYPLFVTVRPSKRIFCLACHIYTSSWVVFGNKRLPEDPFFFCKQCFLSFNYEKNGEKIGEFTAYHFPDHSKLT